MSDYRLIPACLVMLGILASVFVLPDAQDMSTMRAADAKYYGKQMAKPLTLASAQY